MTTDGFHNIWLPFWGEKLITKFLFASMKSLTKSEDPSSIHIHEACPGFRKPVTLKVVPKAACDSEKCFGSQL
jgi:hypothetical protein